MTRPGENFEQADVVQNYRHRPPYASAVFEKLLALTPRHDQLLDLGCGPGKISAGLAQHFGEVFALDASAAMIELAGELVTDSNVRFITGLSEDVDLSSYSFNLIVAAASIHWMDHARLFPRLKQASVPDHVFAVVEGDGAHDPPWKSDWLVFLSKWIPRTKGEPMDQANHDIFMNAYREFLDIQGEETMISEPFRQTIDGFIGCQLSRNTFAPSMLGDQLSAFTGELRELLEPHATDDHLSYEVDTVVTWGCIR